MSNKLSTFWEDCLKDDNLSFNLYINSKEQNYTSLNSNKTKNTSNISINQSELEAKNLFHKKIANKNKRNIYMKYTSLKKEKKYNNKTKIYNDYCSRNKSYVNKKPCISSLELKLRKNLSECTFHPKLVSCINNKNLKEKLFNYSKFTMYERGQIFEMKKEEDKNRLYINEYNKRNVKYPFRPKINKCPIFKKVIFNDSNYDSLNYFYSRMNSARENKIHKKKIMTFRMINNEQIYKNYHNSKNDNNSFNIHGNKINYEKKRNDSLLMNKILNDKETELCKQNLHKALMNLQLNKINQ